MDANPETHAQIRSREMQSTPVFLKCPMLLHIECLCSDKKCKSAKISTSIFHSYDNDLVNLSQQKKKIILTIIMIIITIIRCGSQVD